MYLQVCCFTSINVHYIKLLTLCLLGNFYDTFSSADVFSTSTFSKKKSFRNAIRVSNSLDPDQVRHFVGPDLGPNCLQKGKDLKDKELSLPRVSILGRVRRSRCLQ